MAEMGQEEPSGREGSTTAVWGSPVNTQTATFSLGILAVKNVGLVEGHAAWI
jgi:hypothetical protein